MYKHDSLTETIIDEVAELTNTDPMELEPLHDAIDVDALERLFAPKLDGTPRTGGRISFAYCDCLVTVETMGQVTVESKDRVTVERGTGAFKRRP